MASTKSTKGRLTKRDLAVVQNYLVEIKKKWFDIGIQLDLDPEELDKLLLNDKYAQNDRLRKVLLDWLLGEEPIPTWRALCAALRTPTVNETRVASVIERERIFVDLDMSGVTPESVLSEALSLNKPVSPTKVKSMVENMEPALKKTISIPEAVENTEEAVENTEETEASPSIEIEDQDHVDFSASCAEPMVVQAPFPYLITSGLSVEEKDALLERLVLESADIRLKFCALACNFHASLLSRNINVNKLNDEVRNFHPYYYERVYKYRATDITTAIGLLHNSFNFHFYGVLRHLIAKIGTSDDRSTLQGYGNSHAEFSKRRLFECPGGIFGGSRWEHEEELVVKKSNNIKSINDITLTDVTTFVGEFRKEIKVDEFSMRLLTMSIEDSHLVLYFALDTSLVNSEATFPLSQECKERLMEMEVWHVSCGEFIFQHKPQDEVDGQEEEEEEELPHVMSMEASTRTDQVATLDLRECMSYEDEDIGNYTDLASNNIRQVVEVSNGLATPTTTPYKSYKIGRYRRGALEWVSGMKGIRYGIGKYPKVALNDEGYVVEVDEEDDGKISFRVGIIHPSNVMLWTEATPTNFAGSRPCVAVCWKTVVVAYVRGGDAYYCIGTLDTGQRTIQWILGEHKFLSGGVSGVSLAINSNLEVSIAYSKSSISSLVNPLYFIIGKLAKEKLTFSSDRGSSQSFAQTGWYPCIGMKSNGSVFVVYSQHKSIPYKKIKYCIGKVEKSSKGSGFKVKWGASPEDCFEFASERAAMTVNEKGLVIISHTHNQKYTCHIGKLFQETVI